MEQSNQSKRVLLSVIGVAILVVAVVGVSFAFFNYTRAGADNSIGTGRITFLSTQEGTTAVTNFFPAIPGSTTDQSSVATVHVNGGTTFSGGLQYRVRAVDVKVGSRAYAPATDVPVWIDVENYSSLNDTTNDHGTFTPTTVGNNIAGRGIVLSEGVTLATGTIGGAPANTAAGTVDIWINGTFTVKAYIPSNVAITDTLVGTNTTGYVNGTTTEWQDGRTVLTTEQWNALSVNPVTFKIQVEAIETGGAYTNQIPRTNP